VYRPGAHTTLDLSVARKTRFATVKDRYSYRMGAAIPNPDLQAEHALNYELGYKGAYERLRMQAAVFYSRIGNTILSVNNVKYDTARQVWQSQLQNTGRSEYLGGELGLEYALSAAFTGGLNYTYIKRNNLSNPALYFTDVPAHKLFGFLQYRLQERLSVQVSAEHNSKRYSTTYGAAAGSFTLLNASATVKVWRYFSVEGGINNITDAQYALIEGYPEPGRNYFLNLVYRL
jgi:iron complex outermembrane receptor protein